MDERSISDFERSLLIVYYYTIDHSVSVVAGRHLWYVISLHSK